MRIVSLLLICFYLAFVNVSYAHSYASNCPMGQAEKMGAMEHTSMADCCNDADTFAKTGEPCKKAQSCSVSPLVIFFADPSWRFISIYRSAVIVTTTAVPTLAPNVLWRPPTLS